MLILFCWHTPCIFSRNANQSLSQTSFKFTCFTIIAVTTTQCHQACIVITNSCKKSPRERAFVPVKFPAIGKIKHLNRKNSEKTYCFGHVKFRDLQ